MNKFTNKNVIATVQGFRTLPYRVQGRDTEGVSRGTDCGGLLALTAKAWDVSDADVLGYSNAPQAQIFDKILSSELNEITPKEDLWIADILAFDEGEGLQHIAFVTEVEPRIKIIHAKRNRGVVEHYLKAREKKEWIKTFRFKGIMKTI